MAFIPYRRPNKQLFIVYILNLNTRPSLPPMLHSYIFHMSPVWMTPPPPQLDGNSTNGIASSLQRLSASHLSSGCVWPPQARLDFYPCPRRILFLDLMTSCVVWSLALCTAHIWSSLSVKPCFVAICPSRSSLVSSPLVLRGQALSRCH